MTALEPLRHRIEVLEKTDGVVSAMEALAGSSLRRCSAVRGSVIRYRNAVEQALHGWLQEPRWDGPGLGGSDFATADAKASGIAVVLIGSERGLCGGFNTEVLQRWADVQASLNPLQSIHGLGVVGHRCAALLRASEQPLAFSLRLPQAAAGIAVLTQQLLTRCEQWRNGPAPVEQIVVLHHRLEARNRSAVVTTELHPLPAARIRRLEHTAWPSTCRPMHFGDREVLRQRIVHEWMAATLHLAIVDSLTCEHLARLQRMQAAQSNLNDQLEQLRGTYRKQRQTAITAELLDIVGGVEALRPESS